MKKAKQVVQLIRDCKETHLLAHIDSAFTWLDEYNINDEWHYYSFLTYIQRHLRLTYDVHVWLRPFNNEDEGTTYATDIWDTFKPELSMKGSRLSSDIDALEDGIIRALEHLKKNL